MGPKTYDFTKHQEICRMDAMGNQKLGRKYLKIEDFSKSSHRYPPNSRISYLLAYSYFSCDHYLSLITIMSSHIVFPMLQCCSKRVSNHTLPKYDVRPSSHHT